MDTIKTHYEDLEVAENASPEIIRGAYRYLSQKWLPDRNPERRDEAERISRTINEAYAVLSDPELRREYDAWIATQRRAEADQPAPPAPPPHKSSGSSDRGRDFIAPAAPSTSPPPESPTQRTTQAPEPARLTRKQIWIWIACLIGLRMLVSFVSFAQLAMRGMPTPPEFEFIVRATLTAILGLPLLLGLCYVIGWCLTQVVEKRKPRAKGVLIAAAVCSLLGSYGSQLRDAKTTNHINAINAVNATQDAPVASGQSSTSQAAPTLPSTSAVAPPSSVPPTHAIESIAKTKDLDFVDPFMEERAKQWYRLYPFLDVGSPQANLIAIRKVIARRDQLLDPKNGVTILDALDIAVKEVAPHFVDHTDQIWSDNPFDQFDSEQAIIAKAKQHPELNDARAWSSIEAWRAYYALVPNRPQSVALYMAIGSVLTDFRAGRICSPGKQNTPGLGLPEGFVLDDCERL